MHTGKNVCLTSFLFQYSPSQTCSALLSALLVLQLPLQAQTVLPPIEAQPAVTAPGWSPTGSMKQGRESHTATLLLDGKVLVVGGSNGGSYLSSVELYNPATGTWSRTGSLPTIRSDHTATLLPNGKVLVAGGVDYGGSLSTAILYDPAISTWSTIAPMNKARYDHTATLLPNGKVLVAGGIILLIGTITNDYLSDAELYDPATDTWSPTASLGVARDDHTATLLPNGKVLVAGGSSPTSSNRGETKTELYDPTTGTWTTTGSLNGGRTTHTATLLSNGKVLVAGGYSQSSLTSAELYDPATGIWSPTATLNSFRNLHTATLLPNSQVLVTGGGSTTTTELYNPNTGIWSVTPGLSTIREYHTATLLTIGNVFKVLVVGGTTNAGSSGLRSAELGGR